MTRTLVTLASEIAARGEAPAIATVRRSGVETWTCARLADVARSLCAGLIARGARPGDRIALFAANAPEWIASYLGIALARGVVVALDAGLSVEEALRQLADSGSRFAIVGRAQAAALAATGSNAVPLFVLGGGALGASDWESLLNAEHAPPADGDPSSIAALLYTSGTTGLPKGVPLSHGNLMANVDALARQHLAGPRDRVLVPLPLHHAYPMTVGVLGTLASGASVILPAGLSGSEIAEGLKLGRATILIGVPRLLDALAAAILARVKARGRLTEGAFRAALGVAGRIGRRMRRLLFSGLRRRIGPELNIIASGGARLDPATGALLASLGWEVLCGYGLTETAPILTFTPRRRMRLDSAGRPIEGVELRIAAGESPEILARGPNVFSGYWRNPAATEAAFTADGWFRTGDLGSIDRDGALRITGRLKELIVLGGGKKFDPEQVESVYSRSGLIAELAVLERDGRLFALVVPDMATLKARNIARAAESLRAELDRAARTLPPYARLSGFALVREKLPRTALGKLRRFLLPALYARAEQGPLEPAPPSDSDRDFLARPEIARAWDWLRRRFPDRALGLEMSPQLDLGIDSLGWVDLGLEIERTLGLRLTEERTARIVTLRDLLQELADATTETTPPPVEDPARWLGASSLPVIVAGTVLFALTALMMLGVFRLRIVSGERIPRQRVLLIVPDHASLLDPFALAAALGLDHLRRTYWAGWTGILFANRLARAFSRVARVIPIDPERQPAAALARGRVALASGASLVWFAEGQRSQTGELGPFMRGVGQLALDCGVGVLPVHIEGSFAAWPAGRRWPRRASLTVYFGPVLEPDELRAGIGPDPARQIADRIRAAVAALRADTPRRQRA